MASDAEKIFDAASYTAIGALAIANPLVGGIAAAVWSVLNAIGKAVRESSKGDPKSVLTEEQAKTVAAEYLQNSMSIDFQWDKPPSYIWNFHDWDSVAKEYEKWSRQYQINRAINTRRGYLIYFANGNGWTDGIFPYGGRAFKYNDPTAAFLYANKVWPPPVEPIPIDKPDPHSLLPPNFLTNPEAKIIDKKIYDELKAEYDKNIKIFNHWASKPSTSKWQDVYGDIYKKVESGVIAPSDIHPDAIPVRVTEVVDENIFNKPEPKPEVAIQRIEESAPVGLRILATLVGVFTAIGLLIWAFKSPSPPKESETIDG